MQDNALLISILVFTGIILLSSGLFYVFNISIKRKGLIEKIKKGTEEPPGEEKINSRSNNSDNKSSISFNILESLGNPLKPKSDGDITSLRKNLVMAGYRKRKALVIFYGSKMLAGIILSICFSVFKFMAINALPSMNFIVLFIFIALFGFYLPNIWLRLMISKRQRKILEGLPDALDMMIVCVEAGMGLDSAISRAAKEIKLSNKEVSDELNLVTLELRAGKLRRDALRSLGTRIGLEEVNGLVSLLIQTDKFGTSVAQALRVHSESMRDKRFQRADELAAKLPVKLVLPLIFFIFPSIFVVLAGPAAIRIIRNIFPLLGA
jgi:tight adherence protein C